MGSLGHGPDCTRYRVGQLCIIVSIDRGIVTVTVIKIDRRDSAYD